MVLKEFQDNRKSQMCGQSQEHFGIFLDGDIIAGEIFMHHETHKLHYFDFYNDHTYGRLTLAPGLLDYPLQITVQERGDTRNGWINFPVSTSSGRRQLLLMQT